MMVKAGSDSSPVNIWNVSVDSRRRNHHQVLVVIVVARSTGDPTRDSTEGRIPIAKTRCVQYLSRWDDLVVA
jgi:hypothetical protein